MMEKLINRKKPLTDDKWIEIIEHRVGMEFRYTWEPIEQRFRRYYNSDFALSDNAIIIFFKEYRLAIRMGESEFKGNTPMFPPTLLNNALKIKYRCTMTHRVLNGAKIINTELPIHSFQIPQEDGSFRSLLEILRGDNTI